MVVVVVAAPLSTMLDLHGLERAKVNVSLKWHFSALGHTALFVVIVDDVESLSWTRGVMKL